MAHVDAQNEADRLDNGAAAGEAFTHDNGHNVHERSIGKVEHPVKQGDKIGGIMGVEQMRLVGVRVRVRETRASLTGPSLFPGLADRLYEKRRYAPRVIRLSLA